jgi:uncharacterized damage-inducible protein DinB
MNLDYIQRLFNYTEWANELAMGAAAKISNEEMCRNVGISHGSIFGTLLHMAGAEWIWLERWHGRSPAKAEAWARWTVEACPDLPTLKQRWAQLTDQRAAFVAELDEQRLNEELAFKLLSGDASSMRLIDQMQHVVNHSTMHRGQIVGMVRQFGVEPPATDLIFYLRRDISPK